MEVTPSVTIIGPTDKSTGARRKAHVFSNIFEAEEAARRLEACCICPITQELMTDPVVAPDGQCYQREAAEEWFCKRGSRKSPITGLELQDKDIKLR